MKALYQNGKLKWVESPEQAKDHIELLRWYVMNSIASHKKLRVDPAVIPVLGRIALAKSIPGEFIVVCPKEHALDMKCITPQSFTRTPASDRDYIFLYSDEYLTSPESKIAEALKSLKQRVILL